jgi:hypothetical protein
MEEEKIRLDVEKFVSFHKGRVSLLKEFVKNKIHGRLVYQISFLGVESLAGLLYSKEKNSKKRFISFLSKAIGEDEATKLYNLWRCPLTHEGFITNPFTTLEGWNEDDVQFLSYPDGFKSSVEYPPGSIVAMYENLINYFYDFFKKINKKEIIL